MEDWSKCGLGYRLSMLSRLKQDCDYYLSYGEESADHLWAKDEQTQIETMVVIWKTLDKDDRPEWLTWGDIVYYALKMGVRIDTRPNYVMYFRKNRDDDAE